MALEEGQIWLAHFAGKFSEAVGVCQLVQACFINKRQRKDNYPDFMDCRPLCWLLCQTASLPRPTVLRWQHWALEFMVDLGEHSTGTTLVKWGNGQINIRTSQWMNEWVKTEHMPFPTEDTAGILSESSYFLFTHLYLNQKLPTSPHLTCDMPSALRTRLYCSRHPPTWPEGPSIGSGGPWGLSHPLYLAHRACP